MKLEAYLMSSVIACKANDIVLEELGFSEPQVNEGIDRFKLEEAQASSSDATKADEKAQ